MANTGQTILNMCSAISFHWRKLNLEDILIEHTINIQLRKYTSDQKSLNYILKLFTYFLSFLDKQLCYTPYTLLFNLENWLVHDKWSIFNFENWPLTVYFMTHPIMKLLSRRVG